MAPRITKHPSATDGSSATAAPTSGSPARPLDEKSPLESIDEDLRFVAHETHGPELTLAAATWRWGSDWLWDDGEGPAIELYDRHSGRPIRPRVIDESTGEPIDARRVRIRQRRMRETEES